MENFDSVKSIEMFAFADCASLVNISISDGVTSIGENAFSGCTSLVSITIPDSVISIKKNAFYKCNNLSSIIFENISGWFISDSDSALSGINIPVNDSTLNAVNFTNDYCKFYWKRA